MSIVREFNEKKGTVVLMYKGNPLTPELDLKDPKQLFEVLSAVIDDAYNKIRDAGIK
jgi:hypothetical protein